MVTIHRRTSQHLLTNNGMLGPMFQVLAQILRSINQKTGYCSYMIMWCLPNFAIHAGWIGLSLLIQLHVCLGIVLPTQYDTIWDTQSSNSADSMPLGGGSVGLNVWAESGDLLFYLAHSGAFDENNSLLKLGRVRLRMQPNPFAVNATQFEQRLHLNEGYISFTGDNNTVIHIWVDVETSGIHVNVTSGSPVNLTASYENWRTKGWQMVEGEQRQTSWGVEYVPAIPLPTQYPDNISFVSGGVLSYHHNTDNPLFAWQIPEQNLSRADPWSFYNPITNNTFGAYMTSPQLRPGGITEQLKYQSTNYTAYHLVSPRASTSYQLYVAIGQNQTTEVDKWSAALVQSAASMPNTNWQTTVAWWRSFWDRSHIIINPDAGPNDEGFQVGKNYQYFRFMLGCNAGGQFPTRFNGASSPLASSQEWRLRYLAPSVATPSPYPPPPTYSKTSSSSQSPSPPK
ncbi:CAZyme family GH139 [Aspergillus niger]|nr:CAZyme family GH139 [Aspergillus niger]